MFKKLALILTIGLSLSILLSTCNLSHNRDLPKASVMIRNFTKTSGGTGVILHSYQFHSFVLTNAHVCEVVKDGGVVTTSDNLDLIVESFIKSAVHDLCLIKVQANLNINMPLAQLPIHLYDKITVVGHPHLNPITISHGYFGDKVIIKVVTGAKSCTQEDIDNPDTSLGCLMFNIAPIIKQYQARYVSATVQPGSSGSPVYNEDGEISGLIFAGAGDFSYGYAVPLEYILHFLYIESPELKQ